MSKEVKSSSRKAVVTGLLAAALAVPTAGVATIGFCTASGISTVNAGVCAGVAVKHHCDAKRAAGAIWSDIQNNHAKRQEQQITEQEQDVERSECDNVVIV